MPGVRGLIGFSGHHLRQLRQRNDLSRAAAARAIGVLPHTWGEWELDRIRPLLSHAIKICNLLDCDLSDLVDIDATQQTLAVLRQQARVTAADAAEAIGLVTSSFYKLEKGSSRVPLTSERRTALARLYGVTDDDIQRAWEATTR